VREPEGIVTPLPGRSSEKYLVKTLRATLSQCRGRGFESLHLHPSKVQVKPKEHSEIWAFNASYANLIEN